jgi:hypothetical protein
LRPSRRRWMPNRESWLPVVGTGDGYEVSNLGRVRSRDRWILCKDGTRQFHRGKILTPYVRGDGYGSVRVFGRRREYVHRLVVRAFLGEPPDDFEVCHRDGDPTNNSVDNLYWGSVSDNRFDSVRHGTHVESRKTHCPRGHVLQHPNLYPLISRRARGTCRTCGIARSRAKYGAAFEIEANRIYEMLMTAGRSEDFTGLSRKGA